jgi:hypothetical protein
MIICDNCNRQNPTAITLLCRYESRMDGGDYVFCSDMCLFKWLKGRLLPIIKEETGYKEERK